VAAADPPSEPIEEGWYAAWKIFDGDVVNAEHHARLVAIGRVGHPVTAVRAAKGRW
jgi:hypothetical protein